MRSWRPQSTYPVVPTRPEKVGVKLGDSSGATAVTSHSLTLKLGWFSLDISWSRAELEKASAKQNTARDHGVLSRESRASNRAWELRRRAQIVSLLDYTPPPPVSDKSSSSDHVVTESDSDSSRRTAESDSPEVMGPLGSRCFHV